MNVQRNSKNIATFQKIQKGENESFSWNPLFRVIKTSNHFFIVIYE